jgi:hypothetical protein
VDGNRVLHKFLRAEKRLQVMHLPQAGQAEDGRLRDRPPQNPADAEKKKTLVIINDICHISVDKLI